jgi:maleate isomerase
LPKVGLVLPEANTTIEPEMYSVTPENVSFHTARLPLGDIGVSETVPMNDQSLEHMMKQIIGEGAITARQLRPARVNLVVLTVTAASYVAGLEGNRLLTKQLSEAADAPAITAAEAAIEALRSLSASKICLGAPTPPAITALTVDYLKKSGFDVVSWKGLGSKTVDELHSVDRNKLESLVRDCFKSGADAVLLSGTLLPTLNHIEYLESKFGLPVVSVSQAMFWCSMKLLGIHGRREGKGTLLSSF